MSRYAREPFFRLLGLTSDLERLDSEAAQRDAIGRLDDQAGFFERLISYATLSLPILSWLLAINLLAFVHDGALRGRLAGFIALPLMFVMYFLTVWPFRRSYRRRIREYLHDCGLPTCIACGFDLTSDTSGRCPECGASAADQPCEV